MAVGFLCILPFAYQDGTGVKQSPLFAAYLVIFGGCYLAHAFLSMVMIWRCGPNVEWRGWMFLSRTQLAVWIFNWTKLFGVAIVAL